MAAALGHAACRAGYNVLFVRADGLFKQLHQARAGYSQEKLLRRLLGPDLLILNDFALRRMDSVDPELHKLMDADIAEAQSLGVRGNPGFFINGRFLSGAKPFQDFAKVINAELTKLNVAIPAEAQINSRRGAFVFDSWRSRDNALTRPRSRSKKRRSGPPAATREAKATTQSRLVATLGSVTRSHDG